MRMQNSVCRLALLLCLGFVASPAVAASFTFDFLNPTGVGSTFVDVIPLNTVGATTDSTGKPIGFTINNSNTSTPLTLTPLGLNWSINAGQSLALGVPFPTTGGPGQVHVTARFSNMTTASWNANFEQTAVGFGPTTTTSIGAMINAITFFNSGNSPNHIMQARLQDGDQSTGNTGTTDLELLELFATGTAGSTINAHYIGNNGALDITRTMVDGTGGNSPLLGLASTGAFWVVGGSPDGWTGTLTSITFSGPNLAVLAITPEPSSLAIFTVAGIVAFVGALRLRRRK